MVAPSGEQTKSLKSYRYVGTKVKCVIPALMIDTTIGIKVQSYMWAQIQDETYHKKLSDPKPLAPKIAFPSADIESFF